MPISAYVCADLRKRWRAQGSRAICHEAVGLGYPFRAEFNLSDKCLRCPFLSLKRVSDRRRIAASSRDTLRLCVFAVADPALLCDATLTCTRVALPITRWRFLGYHCRATEMRRPEGE